MSKKKNNRKQNKKKGIYTNLSSNCLVELISEEQELPEFAVSFKRRPLLGKVFIGQYITDFKYTQSEIGQDILDKAEKLEADITHINNELKTAKDEVEKKYREQLEELMVRQQRIIPLVLRINKMRERASMVAKVEKVRLRVTEVIEFDKQTQSWVCICEPADFAYPATKTQKKLNGVLRT
jgi:hypothetical protein